MKNKKFIETPSGKIINIDHIVLIARYFGFIKIKLSDGSEIKLENHPDSNGNKDASWFLEYINYTSKNEWQTKGKREWEKKRKR